jgi:chorismate mutase
VPAAVRALRGATTVDADTQEQLFDRVGTLITEMLHRNGITRDDIISMVVTATEDITSMFPAAAIRAQGLGDVPMLCARELSIVGATPLCIRILLHCNTERTRDDLRHVYLERAIGLNDDLPT